MKKVLALCLLALTLVSCVAPAEQYVRMERNTFNIIAPQYLDYVEKDSALSQEQKERKIRNIDSWDLRIKKAEEDF